MENGKPQNNSSDEIDLGQAFEVLQKSFNWAFKQFLKFILFLKKNSIRIGVILLVGIVAGYGLNKIKKTRYKAEVIVTPNLASKSYLYDVINEIRENIRARDTVFTKTLGIQSEYLRYFDIEIQPVGNSKEEKESSKINLEYMKILANYESNGIIPEVIQTELLKVSDLSHRIIFSSTDKERLPIFSENILAYINSNTYYDGLIKVYNSNSKQRIALNETTLVQIDELISNFSNKMSSTDKNNDSGRIVLGDDEELNISDLLRLKNSLIKENENNMLELKRRIDPITIVNVGRPYKNRTSFFGTPTFLVPMGFLVLFFLVSIFRFIGNKAKEMEKNEHRE